MYDPYTVDTEIRKMEFKKIQCETCRRPHAIFCSVPVETISFIGLPRLPPLPQPQQHHVFMSCLRTDSGIQFCTSSVDIASAIHLAASIRSNTPVAAPQTSRSNATYDSTASEKWKNHGTRAPEPPLLPHNWLQHWANQLPNLHRYLEIKILSYSFSHE